MKRQRSVVWSLMVLAGVAFFCAQAQAATIHTNTGLNVSIKVTIAKNVFIQWGVSTSPDDNGVDHTGPNPGGPLDVNANFGTRITDYTWVIQSSTDTPSSMLQLGETAALNNLVTNQAPNSKDIMFPMYQGQAMWRT